MDFCFDELIDRKGTSCIKYDATHKFLGASGVIPMWVADMDFRTPAFINEAIARRAAHGIFGYPLRGEGYYNSIVAWLERRHQWKIEKDWILFCPGVVPAVNMAVLAFTKPGDKVIVQPPVYFPFFNAVKDHNRTLVFNSLKEINGRLSMDFDDLKEKAYDAAMIILSSPHNPGGSVWTRNELERLADICLKNNVLIISDEIHCDLVFKPFIHIPLASLSPEVSRITITAIAPSKTFNLSGLSTSSVIIEDEQLRKKFAAVIDHLHITGGNIFGDVASEAAYSFGDEYVDSLMDYLGENVRFLTAFAEEHLPLIHVMIPEATFLVWLDCRKMQLTDNELNRFFLDQAGLGLNPGIMFGLGGSGFMRMNIGCPKSVLEKALEQLKAACQQYFPITRNQ